MILKILDKRKGNNESGFVYFDDIVNIKVYWDNSKKFGIIKNPEFPVVATSAIKFGDINGYLFYTNDGNMYRSDGVISKEDHFFVDTTSEYYLDILKKDDILWLAGAKVTTKSGNSFYIVMDTRPVAYLMNDDGKTVEKLQKY